MTSVAQQCSSSDTLVHNGLGNQNSTREKVEVHKVDTARGIQGTAVVLVAFSKTGLLGYCSGWHRGRDAAVQAKDDVLLIHHVGSSKPLSSTAFPGPSSLERAS